MLSPLAHYYQSIDSIYLSTELSAEIDNWLKADFKPVIT